MKLSLQNGVVLNIDPIDYKGQIKSFEKIRSEARNRCQNLGMAGRLLNDEFREVDSFDVCAA